MSSKAKNNNLSIYREEQQKRNKELILKAINHIKSLGGTINFSTISQVTYDIAEPLKKEKGISLAGISKNQLYRSLVEKASLSQNINPKTYSNVYKASNGNLSIPEIKMMLHELRVKNTNLKLENKILKDQLKTINPPSDKTPLINEDIVKKYKYFSDVCSNLISRLLELELVYIDLDEITLNVQMYDDVILQKETLELLYKDKLNELRNEY